MQQQRQRLRALAKVALVAALASPLMAKEPAQPLSSWHGEYFQKRQGGFYFKANATGKLDGSLQITIWDILERKFYSVSKAAGEGGGPPKELWKAPSGKYEIMQVLMVDGHGVKRAWRPTKDTRKKFLVKRQCISNLGLWTVAPDGTSGLKISFDGAPNTYKEDPKKDDSSVAVVIDGFTGLIQETLGGKKVLDASETEHSTQRELRAVVTYTRQVAMFYKLDLFKHNNHAQAIANVLSAYDPNLRKCYTDRLEWIESLRGDLTFTFLLSKATGTMAKLKQTGGSITDAQMIRCVYYELARISFPVPENMVGELTYTYDVK